MPEERVSLDVPWRSIAHGLLIHGRAIGAGDMTQEEFWPLCERAPGRRGWKQTYSETAKRMARYGKYFSFESMAIGPDTFALARTSRKLRYGPGLGLILGIAIGNETVRAALVDANGWMLDVPDEAADDAPVGAVLDSGWHAAELAPDPRQPEQPPVMLLDRLVLVARAVCGRAVRDERLLVDGGLPLLGVAVAWPAPVGHDKRLNGTSFTHPGWQTDRLPALTDLVAARLRLPSDRSHAINDANAVAVSVAFDDVRRRPGARTRTLLALRVSGGLGAGTCVIGRWASEVPRSMFLATRVIEGDGGYAGELGHLPVSSQDMEEVYLRRPEPGLEPMPRLDCACGRPDPCLQTYASATAFVERMKESGIGVDGLAPGEKRAHTSVMHEAMRDARDRRQLRAKRDIGRMIGRALASPVLMLNPSLVALAGSMAVPEVLKGIGDERERWAHAHSEELQVVAVGDNPDREKPPDPHANKYSAVRGAALVVFRRWVYRRFDVLDTKKDPLKSLTLILTSKDILAWAHPRTKVKS